jgi:hypothetical protein
MRILEWRWILAVGCVAVGAACFGAPSAPRNFGPAQAVGSWTLTDGANSHQAIGWTLRDSSGTIIGAGTWSGEAGPSGTIYARGSVANGSIVFDLLFGYDTPVARDAVDAGRFSGVLTTLDRMTGTLTRDGTTPQSVVLMRVHAP